MIKPCSTFLAIAILVFSPQINAHQFYVSISKIKFKFGENVIHLRIRIFTTDLENAVKKQSGEKLFLNTSREISQSNRLIEKYIRAHFSLKVNDKDVVWKFSGKKYDDDVLEWQMRAEGIDSVQKIKIYNDILTELYDGQTNIVRFNINGKKKFFNFTKLITGETIKF